MEAKAYNNILYLDDEDDNLIIFRATFRRDYHIFTANNVKDAREVLKDEEIHLIISDQRMPDMTGVDFLESVSDEYPEAIKMIVTGYSDAEAIIKAINKVGIFRYMTKPWDVGDFRMAINAALQTYALKRQNRDLIADLQTRNIELLYSNDSLLKMNHELDEYVYRVSHEVRAPAASIMGIVGLLRLEDRNDLLVLQNYMQLVEHSVLRLDSYIRSIMQHVELRSNGVDIVDIDFTRLINDCLAEIGLDHHHPRFQIFQNIDEKITIHASYDYFATIFRNLIANAIDFSDEEKIENWLKITVQKYKDNQLEVIFEDNGGGILKDHQHKIFSMFYRASEKSQGTGLGLYIAKLATERLGGKILFESQESKGTTFRILVPLT